MEKLATLKITNKKYNYYLLNDLETVVKKDTHGRTDKNAYWDIDILTEDLTQKDTKILYLADYLMNSYLDNDYVGDEDYISLVQNVKRYQLQKV